MYIKPVFSIAVLLLVFSSFHLHAQEFKAVSEATGLPVGAKAPMFAAKDQYGGHYISTKPLEKGPLVLVFYRGQWCPYCTRYLGNLQDSLPLVYDRGASVVAISPEKPEYLKMTQEKTNADFKLLHDKDYLVGDSYDVIVQAGDPKDEKFRRMTDRLSTAHSDQSNRLPVPATFIISKDGVIVWRQLNPDYKIRATVADILNNLPANE